MINKNNNVVDNLSTTYQQEKKKYFFIFLNILILFFLSINFVNSVSINQLVNSYNYTNSNSNFNLELNNFSILNKNLDINLNITLIKNLKNSNYVFVYGTLNNIFEINKIEIYNLSFGLNNISLNLSLNYLKNKTYNFYLKVYDKNNLVYRNNNLFNFKIFNSSNLVLNSSIKINNQNYILFNESKNQTNSILNNLLEIKNSNNSFFDLSIKNITYNKTSGSLFIKIKNIGNLNSIGNILKVYDENYSLILEKIIPLFLINQSLNLSYTLSVNQSKVLVSILNLNSYEKNIENNFLSWPVNLSEICFDNRDNNRNELIDEGCQINIVKLNKINKGFNNNNNNFKKSTSSFSGFSSNNLVYNLISNNVENTNLKFNSNKTLNNISEKLKTLDLVKNISNNLSNDVNLLVENKKISNKNEKINLTISKINTIFYNKNSIYLNFLKENEITINSIFVGIIVFIVSLFLI